MNSSFSLLFIFFSFYLIAPSIGVEKENFSVSDIILLSNQGKLNQAKQKSEKWVDHEIKIHGENTIHETLPRIILGRICLTRQEYTEASNQFKKTLEIFDKTTGWLYPDYALTLNYLCTSYILQGRKDEAEKWMNQILSILDNTLGNTNANQVHYLGNKGLIAFRNGDIRNAEQYFTEADSLSKTIEEKFTFDNDFSDLKIYIGKLYNATNRQDLAQEVLNKELSRLKEKGWDKSANYARCKLVLGEAMMLDGLYEEAEKQVTKVRDIAEEMLGKNHFAYASINTTLALIFYHQSRFLEAEQLLNTSIQIYQKDTKEKFKYVECFVGLINIKIKRGDYSDVEQMLNKVESLLGEEARNNLYFETTKARWYIINGRFVDAEILLTSQLEQLRFTHNMYTRNFVESYLDLIELQIYMGRVERPKKLLKQGKALLLKVKQDSTINFAEVLAVEAYLAESEMDFQTALKKNQESLQLMHNIFGERHYAMAIVNEQIGRDYYHLHQYDSANVYINESLELFQKYVTASEVHFIQARMYKALLAIKTNDYQSALSIYEELSKETISGTILNTRVRSGWAYTYALLKEWSKAEEIIIAAVEDRFRFYEQTMRYSSSQEKMKYLQNTNTLFDRFFEIFDMMGDEVSPLMLKHCYDIQLQFRDFFLVETRDRLNHMYKYRQERIKQGFPSYTSNILKGRDQIATLNFFTEEQREKLNIDQSKLQFKINNLEKTLVLASNEYVGKQEMTKRLTWENVKEKVKENEVAIEIVKLRTSGKRVTKYIALLVHSQSEYPIKIDLGEDEFLEGKVFFNYQRQSLPLGRGLTFVNEANDDDPYNNYWKPIKDKLAELSITADKIYLVADGIYNLININTLKNPNTEQYVIQEDFVRQLTSTTAEYNNEPKVRKKHQRALLIGNPVFDEKLIKNSNTRGTISKGLNVKLAELPGTGKEIKNSQDMLTENGWEVEIFTRDAAKEEVLKSLKKSAEVIHIATHGFFINHLKNEINENSLLRSGLFFSEYTNSEARSLEEIYQSGNDGILTAFEVAGLNLQNTDLLILSACQSGVSEVTEGKGISGLQYAFGIAGVKTVIMSLWSVDDKATQELMTQFYKHWNETSDRYVAFRQAQLDMLEKYKRPYFWGPFVMVN